jgi:hypothetical protein
VHGGGQHVFYGGCGEYDDDEKSCVSMDGAYVLEEANFLKMTTFLVNY